MRGFTSVCHQLQYGTPPLAIIGTLSGAIRAAFGAHPMYSGDSKERDHAVPVSGNWGAAATCCAYRTISDRSGVSLTTCLITS